MVILETHGFDKCTPPICPKDIIIDIIDIRCVSGNLYVRWNIFNSDNNTLSNININSLLWSCDNQDFSNIVYPANSSQPYESYFDISGCSGVVYLKIKIRIGTSFFESDVENFDTSNCVPLNDSAVRATWYGDCPDSVSTPPAYMLYVRSSSIPSYPVYFNYNSLCWYMDNDETEILVSNLPEGAILTDIELTYSSCNDYCLQSDCPSSWVDPGDGDRIGTYYFEYQTYAVSSNLYVIKNFESSDCNDDFTPSSEKILFNTGCMSTDKEFSPSFYVNTIQCLTVNASTYGFCLQVRESELPLGIVIDCDCESITGSYWRVCSINPDNQVSSWEGGDECLCSS